MRHAVLLAALALACAAQAPKELLFTPVRIDAPVHDPANHTYWFGPFPECTSVLDINGDGKLDVAAGRNYYLAPDWKKHPNYRSGAATNGPDVDDNYEGTMDVNNDGRPDVLSSGWMLKQGIYWYENPGKAGVEWKSHEIHTADGLEGMVIGDLSGKGEGKDLLVNYYAKRPGRGLIWYEHLNQPPWFKKHELGPEHVGVSHGSGIGDINGDGRMDVITTSGWFEAPTRPAEQKWTWHPDFEFKPYGSERPGGAGLPILITDANGDNRNDIIIGSDHGYGLAWFEQKLENGKRTFERHWIETEYPTFHTMALADLDGDGKPELITGKQLLAHNGGDVGALEPSFVFYYTIDKGKFQRHILTYSHLEPYFAEGYKGAPPDYVVGVGMRLGTGDMDGDGRQDIVIACRTGLYIFFNKGYSDRKRGRNPLPTRESYPGNIDWEKRRVTAAASDGYTTLFNSRDLAGWQPATHWTVENGVITLKDRTDRQEHNDNYLWTQQQYRDFILELEFKVEPGANSGIFLRTSDPKDPVYTGIEIQVGVTAPGRPLGKGSPGGIYDLVPPSVDAVKPGEWNKYVIECRGSYITVELNGQKVSQANLNEWQEAGKNPDGSKNKFKRPLKDFAREGYVGLQDHGTPVQYRNIRIKPMTPGGVI